MTPVLHYVKSYLETAVVLRITYSFFCLVWFFGFLYEEVFCLSHSAMCSVLIPVIKWQCITWIPLARSSQTQLLWLCLWQHTTPFSGASLMTGLSVFLNKESPVTQIFLFLMVCIFSPSPSALPSVCRSFSLLFPSAHTPFCTLTSFSLTLLSLYSCILGLGFSLVRCWLIDWLISISVLAFFLSTVIFSLVLQQIFLSAVAFSFLPYHGISLTSH